jgi:hypothetical protein
MSIYLPTRASPNKQKITCFYIIGCMRIAVSITQNNRFVKMDVFGTLTARVKHDNMRGEDG